MPRGRPPGKKNAIDLSRAARLIEERLGVPCTRQGIEYHVNKGNLSECVRSKGPYRLDPDILLEEYGSKIKKKAKGRQLLPDGTAGHYQGGVPTNGQRGGRRIEAPTPPPPQPPAPTADPSLPPLVQSAPGSSVRPNLLTSINAAKAWAELEKARKLQVERLAAEGAYLRRSEVQPAWEKAFLAISRGVMSISSKVKSDHPELSFDVIESVRIECRAALQKVFDDLMELEPEPEIRTEEERMFDLPDEGDMEFEI